MKNISDLKGYGGKEKGFTLIELIIVIAIIAIMAGIHIPALCKAQVKSKEIFCLNNHKQLVLAWSMYGTDHSDLMMPNYQGGGRDLKGWITGRLDWSGYNTDNTNANYLVDTNYAYMGYYISKDSINTNMGYHMLKASKVFKCPSDTYAVPGGILAGGKQRVRSVSMNANLNCDNKGGIEGDSNTGDEGLLVYRKMSDIKKISPSKLWVTVEENPDSINDGCFFSGAKAQKDSSGRWEVVEDTIWRAVPSALHNGSCGFSFADGHSQLRKWNSKAIVDAGKTVTYSSIISTLQNDGLGDYKWFCESSGESYK